MTAISEWAFRRIRYEVVDWAETVVGMVGGEGHRLSPTALAVVAYGGFIRGELDRAIGLAEAAVELRDRLGVRSCGLPERVLGNALFYRGDRAEAIVWIARLGGSRTRGVRRPDRPCPLHGLGGADEHG